MITRNIIISQVPEFKNSMQKEVRGLVTITGDNSIEGRLKVYNINEEILPLMMAIKIGQNKYVIDNISTPNDFVFKLSSVPISSDITILLAKVNGSNIESIAMGFNAGGSRDFSDLFEELSQTQIDDLINDELSIKNQPDILSAEQVETLNEENVIPVEDGIDMELVPESNNFYSLIQPQLDELFVKFPHYKEFENLIQNTEWIKVNYSNESNNHYILGKLYDGERVTHLCYGIPAVSRSISPPSTLTEYCQWIPLNLADPNGSGYWVMYQNAETGENVKL